MREVLITSSVLIAALLVLRAVFRKSISRRVQYALWGLVLLRLLVPVNLPDLGVSVLSVSAPVQTQVANRLDHYSLYLRPTEQGELSPSSGELPPQESVAIAPSTDDGLLFSTSEEGAFFTRYASQLSLRTVLTALWLTGAAVMACWFLAVNLRFWRKLCKVRTLYPVEHCRYPVYLVGDGLPSPCLFGLFRPAIYLTPAAVSTPESLRHVLAHEQTHARHLDPLWSLLRCVCLAVYWFHPLVWAAAAFSRTDCELACDESVLKRLGEEERMAYGKTLLSLIPVRSAPANPLLSATTMTAGKRQLRDRITRIAENRQTVAAALFAAVALVLVVCVITFTGADHGEKARPLNRDELAYFNEEFFNNDMENNVVVGVNLHNQFLTSLYETPADIDLFELFYCGTGFSETMSDDEWAQVGSFDENGERIFDTNKLSIASMDRALLENTGLTLAETRQTGLENFRYLPEYGAYYHSHGDTNYFHSVQIAAGERTGDTLRLYYSDSNARYPDADWLCVTLEAQEDGGYWFLSNLPCEKPAVPTVYPEGEPALTIPLDSLSPYVPEAAAVERHTDDCAERGGGYGVGSVSVRSYLSTDGNTYAAVVYDEAAGRDGMLTWDVGCFLKLPEGAPDFQFSFFSDLFGREGLVISYTGQIPGRNAYNAYNDYYTFAEDGTPTLLARAYGETAVMDLDGDGENELAASAGSTAQLFFQRDGQLYCAELEPLLADAWPEAQYLSFGNWDLYGRYLPLYGEVPIPDAGCSGTAFRHLYFDGGQLLAYRTEQACQDHVTVGITAPGHVMASARAFVLAQYQGEHEGYRLVDGEFEAAPVEFDDWRILSLTGPAYETAGSLKIEIWRLNYELHTTTPDAVILAGGRYMTEDCWVSPGYPDCDYLYFTVNTDSGPAFLFSATENDCFPGTELFLADLVYRLMDQGLLTPAELDGQTLLDLLSSHPVNFLNRLAAEWSDPERTAALETLGVYLASNSSYDVQKAYQSAVRHLELFGEDLTAPGRAAWEQLWNLKAAHSDPTPETVLARFTANPVLFLNETATQPPEAQAALCRTLAQFYAGGTSAQRARFHDSLHSVTQPGLGADATAVYELLRTACPLPEPASRTAADDDAICEAVFNRVDSWRETPGVAQLAVLDIRPDEAETARAVAMYTASLTANANGWSDGYTAKMAVAQAVWSVELDTAAAGSSPAAKDWDEGVNACYFYLLPNQSTGNWEIIDSMSCAVPESPARKTFTKADVEFSGQALESEADSMSYGDRLAWVQAGGGELFPGTGTQLSITGYQEADGCLAYAGSLDGTPHTSQNYLYLRFGDGTLAQLPLVRTNGGMSTAAPDTMAFSGGQLVYTTAFADEEIVDRVQLIHLSGAYRYTVDLEAKTVSLSVL